MFTLSDLTLEERNELERMYDGPISERAIADVTAQRGAAPPVMTGTHWSAVAFALAQMAFYATEASKLAAEISKIDADTDGTYSPEEAERKGGHLDAIRWSYDAAMREADYFRDLVTKATEGK
jgi:hypothetical protein